MNVSYFEYSLAVASVTPQEEKKGLEMNQFLDAKNVDVLQNCMR